MTRIFVEGLPGAGKTTTSKALRKRNVPVARDFGLANGAEDYPGNGKTIEEILAIDDWFIEKEAQRMESTEGIFDRSYLGNLTYAYAYGRFLGLNSLKPTTKKYEHAISIGQLALPEGLVYIDIDSELSIERQHKRTSEGIPLLDEFWQDKHFLNDLRDSHTALFNSCSNISIVTISGESEPDIVASGIADFYTGLNYSAAPLERRLDLGRFLNELEIQSAL
ncbi:MAG: AAA family ATPase [Chloroflexota bacterium]